jgi:hypothetical protein
MARKARAWLLVLLSTLLVLSCTRLEQRLPTPAFGFEPRQGGSTIPREYGKLVAITPVEGRQYQVMMWFEQSDDRIVGVRINVASGVARDDVLVIPRGR